MATIDELQAREAAQLVTNVINKIRAETVGWTFSFCCTALHRDEDIREMELPGILEQAIQALNINTATATANNRQSGEELLWFKCINCKRSGLYDHDTIIDECGCLDPDFKIMKKQRGYKAYSDGTLQKDWVHPDGEI